MPYLLIYDEALVCSQSSPPIPLICCTLEVDDTAVPSGGCPLLPPRPVQVKELQFLPWILREVFLGPGEAGAQHCPSIKDATWQCASRLSPCRASASGAELPIVRLRVMSATSSRSVAGSSGPGAHPGEPRDVQLELLFLLTAALQMWFLVSCPIRSSVSIWRLYHRIFAASLVLTLPKIASSSFASFSTSFLLCPISFPASVICVWNHLACPLHFFSSQ